MRSGRQTAALAVAGALMLAGVAAQVARLLRGESGRRSAPPDDLRTPPDPGGEFVRVRDLAVHVKRADPPEIRGEPNPRGRAGEVPDRAAGPGTDGGGVRAREAAGSERPPLLLMHGFAASVFTWRAVMPALARGGTVVAYDRPAFGRTSRPLPGEWEPGSWPQGTPYGPEAQAEIAVGLMDALGMGTAVLVGNSMGGAVAALTAVRHPERVAGLVLVDAAILRGGPPSWTRRLIDNAPFRATGPTLLRAFPPAVAPGLRYLYHDPGLVTPDVVEGYLNPLRHPRAEAALYELARAGGSSDLADEMMSLSVPTLVMGGRHDPLVTPAHNRSLAERIPDAELRIIEQCGHMPQEERPERFVELLDEFWRGLSPAEGA